MGWPEVTVPFILAEKINRYFFLITILYYKVVIKEVKDRNTSGYKLYGRPRSLYISGKSFLHKSLSTPSNKTECWFESWDEKSVEIAKGSPCCDIRCQDAKTRSYNSSFVKKDVYSGHTFLSKAKPT